MSGIWVSPYLNNISSQMKVIEIQINTNTKFYIDKIFDASWIEVPIKTPLYDRDYSKQG